MLKKELLKCHGLNSKPKSAGEEKQHDIGNVEGKALLNYLKL